MMFSADQERIFTMHLWAWFCVSAATLVLKWVHAIYFEFFGSGMFRRWLGSVLHVLVQTCMEWCGVLCFAAMVLVCADCWLSAAPLKTPFLLMTVPDHWYTQDFCCLLPFKCLFSVCSPVHQELSATLRLTRDSSHSKGCDSAVIP